MNDGTLHKDRGTFIIISHRVLLRMRNVSHKSCRENRNTNFMSNNGFFFLENRAVYEIKWKKNRRTGQTTDDKIAHAPCMLDI